MKKIDLKIRKGFSLIETLIALFVLSMGILGMLVLMAKAVTNSAESRDLMIASQLAQEGVELARWVRDNQMQSSPTEPPFSIFGPSGLDCKLDFNLSVTPFDRDINCLGITRSAYWLNFNHSPIGILGYSHHVVSDPDAEKSKFSRKINISEPDLEEIDLENYEKRKIVSYVFWGPEWENDVPPNTDACTIDKRCIFAEGQLTDYGNN